MELTPQERLQRFVKVDVAYFDKRDRYHCEILHAINNWLIRENIRNEVEAKRERQRQNGLSASEAHK